MAKVFFINNDGGGFAESIEVAEGTTISQLFQQKMSTEHETRRPEDFLIRVNRQASPASQVLQDGDRISITPVKIEGA